MLKHLDQSLSEFLYFYIRVSISIYMWTYILFCVRMCVYPDMIIDERRLRVRRIVAFLLFRGERRSPRTTPPLPPRSIDPWISTILYYMPAGSRGYSVHTRLSILILIFIICISTNFYINSNTKYCKAPKFLIKIY